MITLRRPADTFGMEVRRMGALALTVPTHLGTAIVGNAVASSDTIAPGLIGRGVNLEILNGNASVDSMTISDAGSTDAGTPLAGGTYAVSVPATSNKIFFIHPSQADPVTGVTITHSVTATVTYKLTPAFGS